MFGFLICCYKEQPMSKLFVAIKRFFVRKEEGATMTEYGIMVALIAAVAIGTVVTLGKSVNSAFNAVVTQL
jgi:pilus assembly protein Flp/PilA